MSNTTPQTQKKHYDDEIDLFQLFKTLWHGKYVVIFISLLFLTIAVCYTLYTTPVYESRSYLLPPTEKGVVELSKIELLGLNETQTNLATINNDTRQIVYQTFLQRLNSNHAKQLFFNQQDVNTYFLNKASNQLQAWKLFNKSLSINIPKKGNVTKVDISFKADTAELAARWTNSYVNMVVNLTRKQLTDNLQEQIKAHLNELELLINNRHKQYQAEIDSELEKLSEALLVAHAVNLTDPLITNSTEQTNPMMVDEIRRLYRSGSTALKAEISAIKQRRNNKALIPGITILLQHKALIESLDIDSSKIQPAQIDLTAQVDNKPIAPKKGLILALSLILGLIAGVIIVLIRSAINNREL